MATLPGAPKWRWLRVRTEVDRAAQQGAWLGVHFVEAHSEKTLYQDTTRRRTGRLAESAAICDRQCGRAPPERQQERG